MNIYGLIYFIDETALPDQKEMEHDLPRLERITAQKKLITLQRELKQRKQTLFFDGLRLEQALEEGIAARMNPVNYIAEATCKFVIRMEGQ